MTLWTLILRSLRYHFRSHLGVLLGASIGSAVLIGALLVGESVKVSLREMGMVRLGIIETALNAGDRFFQDRLLEPPPGQDDFASLVYQPVLQVQGTASTTDGSARANRVQVIGIGTGFSYIFSGDEKSTLEVAEDSVALNHTLADQLKAKPGDTIILRVPKPSKVSRDAPLTPQDDTTVALRLKVSAIANDKEMGRFSLQANQVAPFNAFVQLKQLQNRLGETNRANLLLGVPLFGWKDPKPFPEPDKYSNKLVKQSWQLADAELELRELPKSNELELRTGRIFLDPPIVAAALKASTNANLVLTYFVNELRSGTNATPYSMVTAMSAPIVPQGMKDDEAVINQWLADDLKVKAGDTLGLSYFTVGLSRTLEERTNTFRIHSIVPLEMPYADRELMPEFPGVSKAESTSEWDGSLPVTMDKIRPQDEKYWKDYRGTPKAFLTFNAANNIWSNRFGNVTAIRFKTTGDVAAQKKELEKAILSNLDPSSINLRFEPVREQALKASAQSQDFGGLFIGFSFFLIIAALLLTSLLFQFGVEQRSVEVGTLLALGFTPKQVRRLLLFEGTGLAVIGAVIGVFGGIAYAKAMLHGLTTIWRTAVGTSALDYHGSPTTLGIGVVASVLVAAFTIWLALRKQAARPARELLADENVEFQPTVAQGQKRRWSGKIAIVSLLLAIATAGYAFTQPQGAAESFFGAGSFLLVAALAGTSAMLTKLNRSHAAAQLSLSGMGMRNATRRRKRSLATVAMLACGSFLIASIGVFRLDENEGATKRNSGTGGFALIGEATLPVVQDLNTAKGRSFYGLDAKDMTNVSVVAFRVRDGDDASCLNLNRAQKPRLLGVKPEQLAERGAFTFASVAKGLDKEKPWLLLKSNGSDPVPAIADNASIMWALGKKVGDTLDYTDERGRTFQVRLVAGLANSILQGNLIIDEQEFAHRFPGESGYRMFLIDAPSNQSTNVAAVMSKQLQDAGIELTPTTRRLAAFNAVQNTYLSTFQVLGGLGLLLGSAGLGVVVLRNVLERRSELALLLAVGFRAQSLKWLVLSEHGALLVLGLASGVVAAGLAVLPAVLAPGAEVPYLSLGITLGAVLVSGAIWTWAATMLALRGKILDALRNG